ncbi:MAG: N-acetyl-alpha-D-glucosaminyl L-malate synthase BshA [Bacteroidetes bacterium]|nr:N-acetyl-alpha-D-glucosaminyl L-malate synthase BshA [Bacteroidota bacterium]
MKIGITCYPTFGGSGVVATELGLALAERGHCVHFISYAMPMRLTHIPPNVFFHEVQVNVYPLFQYPSYDTALSSKMVDVTLHEKLDLLHVHYAIPHATSAYLAKQILKTHGCDIKVVTTLHGTDITLIGQDPNYIPSVEFGIDQSDGVTAVSDWLKIETNRVFNISKEIKVIHNFIDFNRFFRNPLPELKKRFSPEGERLIIHVSNFRPLKRVNEVVLVFAEVLKTVKAKLLLVGDGPERVEAERLCRKLGLCDHIFFMGKYEAVEELLSISDVFIMPSESETFGLAALEAMACGVPVVSSDIGGLPELNIDGVSGYLCELGNVNMFVEKTLSILSSDDSLSTFREGAIARAKIFDANHVIGIYENYYQEILAGK